MKLTKENLLDFANAMRFEDCIYQVTHNNIIKTFKGLCCHRRHKGLYAFNDMDVTQAVLISIYTVEGGRYFTDYDEAKNALLEKVLKDVEDIKEVYFNLK